jgi:hypothetical protein
MLSNIFDPVSEKQRRHLCDALYPQLGLGHHMGDAVDAEVDVPQKCCVKKAVSIRKKLRNRSEAYY